MLNATYGIYQHDASSEYTARALSYSLPTSLHGHVDVISPTTFFATPRSSKTKSPPLSRAAPIATELKSEAKLTRPRSVGNASADCNDQITPDCIRELYNFQSYTPRLNGTNKLGVVGYDNEPINSEDLQVRDDS